MPKKLHTENHFSAGPMLRDIVIGMSDGLTVPFALAAGLTGAVTTSNIIITAGLAEVAAGAIAMGLGGYLAAKGDSEHYYKEKKREEKEVKEVPQEELREIREIFLGYGLDKEAINPIEESFKANPQKWVDFMMRFELDLAEPEPGRARVSAMTISLSYIAGGLIPLSPYFFVRESYQALLYSVAVTIVALLIFGYGKGAFVGTKRWRSAWQTLLVGSLAAGAAFAIARLISG